MRRLLLSTVFSTLFIAALSAQAVNALHSRRAIICLTYDDGLETQLNTVIPQLDSAGFKATFFLNSIAGSSASATIGQTPEAVLGWTNAAKNGHELANHTLFHACPETLGWDKTVSIENYSLTRVVKEIEIQNSILALLDPVSKKRSFAFPCNNFIIGKTDYTTVLKKLKLISYARGGGDSTSIITDFKHLDPLKVPSWHVWTATTLSQLISFAEKVRKSGGMGVYQLHGVGGQIFAISPETHRGFLAYLKAHESEYWVTTFSTAMNAIAVE